MKKKIYIIPTTGRIPMQAGTLLGVSGGAEQGIDEGGGSGGPTGVIDKDKTGGDESDAKRFNAWSTWDE